MCANILLITSVPADKANEQGQVYVKVGIASFPKMVKRVGDSPYVRSEDDGIKTYSILEIEDVKLGEAVKELTKYYTQYHSIPGFKWKMDIIVPAKDALPMIGLKPPTR